MRAGNAETPRPHPVSVPPALEPLTVPAHVEAPVEPGRACLAMAIAALEPGGDPHARFDALPTTEGPDPGTLALGALRAGLHAVLHGPVDEAAPLEEALDAGLVHRREAGSIRHVLAALEAGHPAVVLVDRQALHEASPRGPHWVLATRAGDHEVTVHDPLLEEGPTTVETEALPDAMGVGRRRLVLELAPATRIDRD